MFLLDTQNLVTLARIVALGIGATAFTDLVVLVRSRCFGIPSLDYAMVGRWMGHLPKGQLIHRPITKSDPIPGEKLLGWTAHYLIGVGFAGLFLMAASPRWLDRPDLLSALFFGLLTVAAPFLLLQPCLGAGLAARKTPRPQIARLRSVFTHLVFGLGLWITGWGMALFVPQS